MIQCISSIPVFFRPEMAAVAPTGITIGAKGRRIPVNDDRRAHRDIGSVANDRREVNLVDRYLMTGRRDGEPGRHEISTEQQPRFQGLKREAK